MLRNHKEAMEKERRCGTYEGMVGTEPASRGTVGPSENCDRDPAPGMSHVPKAYAQNPFQPWALGSDMLANTLQYRQGCTACGFLIHKSRSLVTFLFSLSFLANRSLENSHYSPEMTTINTYAPQMEIPTQIVYKQSGS